MASNEPRRTIVDPLPERYRFAPRSGNKANPFFLYLAYNAVHAPAEAPEADIKAYQAKFPGT